MDHYGQDNKGGIKIQSVPTLPEFVSAAQDERRLIYCEDTETMYIGGSTGWKEAGGSLWAQTIGTFTATPASASTLTMTEDLTALIIVGLPLRYIIGGTTYYGVCAAIAANLLTIAGPPLGGDVTSLSYGKASQVIQIIAMIPGLYEDANNTTLIDSDLNSAVIWDKPKAYLAKFSVYSKVADTGDDGQASVRINDTEVNTTAGGETIATAKTWYPTVVNIDPAAYDINNGEAIELTAIKGSNGDATDLTVSMVFVIP